MWAPDPLSFSCSTSVAPETSTIWWCILKIIISHELYLLCSSDSQPKSCTIFVTQPGVLSAYAEWTNLAAFRWTCSNFRRKGAGFGSNTGDEYSRVGLTIVVSLYCMGMLEMWNAKFFPHHFLIPQLLWKPITDLIRFLPCPILRVRYQISLAPPTAASSPIVQEPKEAKGKAAKAALNHPLRILIMNCQSIKNKKGWTSYDYRLGKTRHHLGEWVLVNPWNQKLGNFPRLFWCSSERQSKWCPWWCLYCF